MNSKKLNEITKKMDKGTATKREERLYNYYVASWGI